MKTVSLNSVSNEIDLPNNSDNLENSLYIISPSNITLGVGGLKSKTNRFVTRCISATIVFLFLSSWITVNPVAAATGTLLTLNTPSSSVGEGDTITFTGRLIRADTGAGIAYATVKIYDSDTWPTPHDLLASGTTDAYGYFSISWVAKPMDWLDRTVEIYAKYDGSSVYNSSTSSQYTVTVTEKKATTLTLDAPASTSIPEGDNITFTGRLTRKDTGAGVAGATIKLYDSDTWPIPHDFLASGTTNSTGYFSITWTAAPMDLLDSTVEVYAKYEGSTTLKDATSSERVITVTEKKATTLTLDAPASTAYKWGSVTFVGRLTRDDTRAGVGGVVINIYDKDLLFDDFLVSGATDGSGNFSITWTVWPSADDFDDTVEVYAKFDGSRTLASSSSSVFTIRIVGVSTTLILNHPPSEVREGDVVTFTGRLTRNDTGAGIAYTIIKIYDADWLGGDLLVSGYTNSDGYFSLNWAAKPMDLLDRIVEVYAEFEGLAELTSSESAQYEMKIGEKLLPPTPGALAESEHPYRNNTDNWWTITEPGAGQMRVHFSRLETESGWDYVFVYDENYTLMASYTGTHNNIWTPWINGGIVRIRLRSNAIGVAYGFVVDAKESKATPQEPVPTNKYAVIVGVGDYERKWCIPISYLSDYALRWKTYLEGKGYQTYVLTDGRATEANIKSTVAKVVMQATANDTIAYVHLAHGGKNKLTCYDYYKMISDDELQTMFSNYRGKLFVFLEACHSGSMNEVVTADPNKASRYMATPCAADTIAWTCWSRTFLTNGLVYGRSGHQDMEGNFLWAKTEYMESLRRRGCSPVPVPQEFDGNPFVSFYL